MSNGPIDLEAQASGVPSVAGREIDNPDNNPEDKIMPVNEQRIKPPMTSELPGLEAKLQFIPEELHDRVRKLTRSDFAGPGIPIDREAYNAYLYAEKMLRDQNRSGGRADIAESKGPRSYSA